MTLRALLMTFSDGSSCGITFDCHSYDSGGVIYNHNIFTVHATGQQTADLVNRLNNEGESAARFCHLKPML